MQCLLWLTCISCFIGITVDASVQPVWMSQKLETVKTMPTKNALKVGPNAIIRMKVEHSKLVGYLKLHKRWRPNFIIQSVKEGDGRRIRNGMMEVLKKPPARVKVHWVKGKAGQSVPFGAVVSGWKICSNLYVVKIGTTPGYYDPSRKCARVYPGRVGCATNFEYLIFTDTGETYFDFYDKFFHCKMCRDEALNF